MDQKHSKQDVADSYNKMREFLQFMASRPDLSGGIRYVKSERHRYEVEHSTYARQLRRGIRLLEA